MFKKIRSSLININLVPYAVILGAGIIAYRKIIFSTGPSIEIHDIPVLFYPTYFFVKQAFMSGQIPFWDPHLVFGQPLIFNFGLGLLYFPFLLFLFLSGISDLVPRHMELFIIIHHILAGITMYWGMRKIGVRRAGACLGGIIFQLFIANQEMFIIPPMSFGLPWVPLATFYFFSCLSSNKEWKGSKDCTILILSYFMLICATHPHLLAYTYFQTFLIGIFFIVYHTSRKNFSEAISCIKKSFFYPVVPIFLAAFIILPILHYMPYTTRWIPVESYGNIGPLNRAYFPTIILPILTWKFSSPYAYTGILTMLFACGYCLLVNKEDRKRYDFFWILLAVFWILFSIEKSPLYKTVLKHVPFMQSMRFSYRGMIFYTLSVSTLAGSFFDVLCYSKQRLKFQWSTFLIFPAFLVFMLIYTAKPFFGLIKNYPIEIDFRLLILVISVGLFCLSLFIRNKTTKILIPIWLVTELAIICNLPISKSHAPVWFPYDMTWNKYKEKYYEVYNDKSVLYRIENYDEPLIIPYYFNTYSVHGYLSQATHPRNYYYLWQEHGGWFGYKYYRFWDLAYLPFYSPIYDLAGVKFFITDGGTEAYPLPREIRGQGEWIEATLSKPDYITKIRLYNTQSDSHRRLTRGHLDLDNEQVISFNLPMESGWHEFSFEPIRANMFRLTADEVKFQRWDGTDGVMIGEIELYNPKGEKIEIATDSIKTSSTFVMSNNHNLIDGDPEMPWESGCRMALKEMMETDTVEEIGRSIFINKNALPRVFMVRKTKILNNIGELAKELHKKDFNPAEVLLVEKQPEKPPHPSLSPAGRGLGVRDTFKIDFKDADDKIKITNYGLNRVDITADIRTPGYLVLTDTYLPGWRVSVNGRPGELLRAYGYFRTVALERGNNKITFHYFPPMFIPGIIISAFTFLLLIIRKRIIC